MYSFPALPLETFHGLPGLIADSLPDRYGSKLIAEYLARQGRDENDISVIERLLYTGSRGMGALEYVPSKEMFKSKDTSVDIDALVKLASDILSERTRLHVKADENVMEQIIRVGTSAGGARAKAVVAWNEQTGDIRSGQINTGCPSMVNVMISP